MVIFSITILFFCLFLPSCEGDPDVTEIRQLIKEFRLTLEKNDMQSAQRIMPGNGLSNQKFYDLLLSEIPENGDVRINKADKPGVYHVMMPSFALEAVRNPDGSWILSPYVLRTQTIDFIPAEK